MRDRFREGEIEAGSPSQGRNEIKTGSDRWNSMPAKLNSLCEIISFFGGQRKMGEGDHLPCHRPCQALSSGD